MIIILSILPHPIQAQEKSAHMAVLGSGAASLETGQQTGLSMLGFDPRPCDAELAGYIRYNSAKKRPEVCHSAAWVDWSGKE